MDLNFENIIKHLEYRGYRFDAKSDTDILYSFVNDHYPNIVCWRYPQGLRIYSSWNIKEKKNNALAYYEYINKLNFFNLIGRYVDLKDSLFYMAFYAYPYEKAGFSNFIDLYLDDCNNLYDDSIGNIHDYIS